MKISQSQQKLKTKASLTGFFVSLFIHLAIVCPIILMHTRVIFPLKEQNTVAIALKNFELGGGKSALPPALPETKPEPEPEKVIEKNEDKIVKKVEQVKKKEKKVVKKVVQKKAETKPKEQVVEQVSDSPSQVSQEAGNNAINPNMDTIAKGSSVSQTPKQSDEGEALERTIGAEIRSIIASYAKKNYPKKAKMARITGITTIKFVYNPDGSVTSLEVLQGSHQTLDEATLKAVEKTKHKFPKIAKSTTFTLPIQFTLN